MITHFTHKANQFVLLLLCYLVVAIGIYFSATSVIDEVNLYKYGEVKDDSKN